MPSKSPSEAWREAHRHIEMVLKAGEAGGAAALPLIGLETTNVIKVLLTGPSPSSPGKPPGLIFGGLRLSYNYEVTDSPQPGLSTLAIGSDASTPRPITGEAVDYAKYLEEGTSKMPARPHLRPAMAIMAPLMGPMISRSITAAERVAAKALPGTTIR